MVSWSDALEIVLRCIRAIAGRADPISLDDLNTNLEELGLIVPEQITMLRGNLEVTLHHALGYRISKNSLREIDSSWRVKDVANLIINEAIPDPDIFR